MHYSLLSGYGMQSSCFNTNDMRLSLSLNSLRSEPLCDSPADDVGCFIEIGSITRFYLVPKRRALAICYCSQMRRPGLAER